MRVLRRFKIVIIQEPTPVFSCRGNLDASLRFTGKGFVLERQRGNGRVKEWTLYLSSEDIPEEEPDTSEEDPEETEDDEELLKCRKEEENFALVLAMKREWEVWLHVLPFPPALDQFEPGVYTMEWCSLNPGVLKGLDFDDGWRPLNYLDFDKQLDFVSAPKVSPMFSAALCLYVTISGDQAHLEPFVSGAERAANYSVE